MHSQGWRFLRNLAYGVAAVFTVNLLYLYGQLASASSVTSGMQDPQGFFFGWAATSGIVRDLRSQLLLTFIIAALAFALAFLAQYNAGRALQEERKQAEEGGLVPPGGLNPPPPSF